VEHSRFANDLEQPDERESQGAVRIQIATTSRAFDDFVGMVPHLSNARRGITPRHTDLRPRHLGAWDQRCPVRAMPS